MFRFFSFDSKVQIVSSSIGVLSHWIDTKNIESLSPSIGILSHWIDTKNIELSPSIGILNADSIPHFWINAFAFPSFFLLIMNSIERLGILMT